MVKEKRNICLVNTVYTLFLYFLIKGYNEDDIFIFNYLMPNEISNNVKHIQLPHISFVDGPKMAPLNSINGVMENILGYCRYFYTYLKLRILLFIKTFNKEVSVYGHAHTTFSYIFYENENSNVIEDGLMNYYYPIIETHKINPVIDKFLHFCGIYFLNVSEGLGSHKNIKNVYLTKKCNHPLIKDKVKLINMKKSWNALPDTQKIKILNVFNLSSNFTNLNGKTLLILTQGLTDDAGMTLEEEIEIYKHMINKFKEYTPIIKPHPRDKINYKEIFEDIEVLEKAFPIELLNLIGFNPTIVASVASTALLNFEESEIYVYNGYIEDETFNELRRDLIKVINENNIKMIF